MKKLLVANRSEIACRIFRTCREMGIPTVAIYAPGDEQGRHVTFADQAIPVKSYLDVESIVAAAKSVGATMIHPGYGFLSERPVFARAVEDANIIFIGPRAETMEQMGGKIPSKEVAVQAQVPILPWEKVNPGQDLSAAAKRVGFPLLLKASAGGGGKGMRRVDRADQLESAAESAMAEAQSAFGDGTLFLEKLLIHPRHIEVQVFGDGRGNAIHFHERECSLQRRHQKVWEEAPAPHLSPETRKGLQESALRLAKKVKYRSAGTLEYLVDSTGSFYFLEMNTRLQVEHPVTENINGVDLVRLQIELAQNHEGFILPHTPEARGHSIEVRLYAEDPAQGYLPTPGKIERLKFPDGPGIRVDSGIEEGQEIGTQFDSMLAKLIVYAPDRGHAVEKMRCALEDTVILGTGSNQAFLRALSKSDEVKRGEVHTHWIDESWGKWDGQPQTSDFSLLSAVLSATSNNSDYSHSQSIHEIEAQGAPYHSPWRKK